MIRVGIVGGTGKLGRDIIRLLIDHEEITLGAVIARKNNSFVGKDLGILIDSQITNIIIDDDILAASKKCDVYIDCTNADSFMENYDAYILGDKPVIIATTGFESKHMERITMLAESIPVVICPNFSIGVYKFLKLIKLASIEFNINTDIDILEYHHKLKKDKPSGTAIAIANTIRESGFEEQININSVRAGNIIGEHSVLFTTSDNERIEISHKIYSREGFSRGVIETIKWIINKDTGLFGIEDVFK